MSEVLCMKNGRTETVIRPKDFEDLVDKYMGMYCANYYQNQIEHLSAEIRELAGFIEEETGNKIIRRYAEEVLKEYGF